ncbi:MAG: transposase [Acetobacteraceae bacterium]
MALAGDGMDRATDSAMHQHRHEAGDYRRIEVITGSVRRRQWAADEKAEIIAESLQPGMNVSELARRRGVNRGLLQTWRREAMREAADGGGLFIPLRIEDTPSAVETEEPPGKAAGVALASSGPGIEHGTIEIESAGLRVRFSGPIDGGALRLVLAHVGRRA